MESANLHLPADQFIGSPPNLAAPSCFGYGSNLAATWSSSSTPTTTLSTNIVTSDGIISNSSTRRKSTDHHQNHDHHNNILVSEIQHNPLNSSSTTSCNLVQDLGFLSHHQSAYSNEQLSRIKEEFSEISFPKFTELLMNSPSNSNVDVHGNFLFKADHNFRDLSYCSSSSSSNNSTGTEHHQSPLMVKSFSSSCQINAPEFDHSNGTTTATSGFGGLAVQGCRGQFSQIYPTVNISNSSQYSLMGMNLKPGFDHLAGSTRFYNSQPNLSNFGVDPIQQQHRLSCSGHSKTISSFNSEITEAKRPGSLMEPKMSTQNKKSRLESRTPCPPFKVRKEKLGDRIAALQQLVSPFGKTDTASVLMEAIGYINFLQNQVETLSVPYMKTGNKSTKTMQGGQKDQDGNIKGEEQRDLKSRGLCLVPLSCMSYVTGDGGGGSIWPPVPNFSTGRIT